MGRSNSWIGLGALQVLAVAVPLGCSGNSLPPYDRAALLSDLVDVTILPGQRALAVNASALASEVDSLCASVDAAHLEATRAAWVQTLIAWERTAAYRFGPAQSANLDRFIASFPPDPNAIEAAITGTATLDEASISALGGDQRGLHALELLLFAPDEASAAIALGDTPRRCEMASALAADIESSAAMIRDAWEMGFAAKLETAGELGNAEYPAQLSAIVALLEGVYGAIESVKNEAIGVPIGAMSGRPDATLVRARHAGVAVELMEARVESAIAVWNPSGAAHSLDGFLRSRRPDLADRLLTELSTARAAVEALPQPFDEYVVGGDVSSATSASDSLRIVERTVRADAGSTLGVAFTGTPDGD